MRGKAQPSETSAKEKRRRSLLFVNRINQNPGNALFTIHDLRFTNDSRYCIKARHRVAVKSICSPRGFIPWAILIADDLRRKDEPVAA